MSRGLFVLAVALVLATPARAAPPTVDARAFTVVNAADGTVLASSNAHEPLPVASITKLMTVIVALQHLRPDDDVKVTAQAAHVGEESIPLRAGQVLSVHDLLEGALIQSANDAADALAAGASGGDIPPLLAWGVSRYRTLTLVGSGPVVRVSLPYGRAPVALVATRPLVRAVRTGRPVVERVIAPSAVDLPVRRGMRLGRIEVWAGRTLLGSRPLLAARSVSRPGVGGRLRWYATRTAPDLWGPLPGSLPSHSTLPSTP